MKQREEDVRLVPHQFDDLNREFYTGKQAGPHTYVKNRLRALLLATSDSELIARAAEAGFEIGVLKLAYKPDSESDEDEDARERAYFLITESAVLLHHAGEALLRMFFAHAEGPRAHGLKPPGCDSPRHSNRAWRR